MTLNYKILGDGGTPMVILHGLLGSLDNWLTLGRHFSKTRQVILVDARNHGRSPHDAEVGYEAMAEDVLELLDELHIAEAVLLGHSMGGKTAMYFALKYPARVQKLIIVDISMRTYRGGHETIFRAMLNVPLENMNSREEVESALKDLIPVESVRLFIMKNLFRTDDGKYAWKAHVSLLWDQYEQLMGFPAVVPGTQFDKPVLVVRGQMSEYISPADEIRLRSFFPHLQLVTIPNAGHWVHADEPEAFAEAIDGFL